jgi:hypothetical protein
VAKEFEERERKRLSAESGHTWPCAAAGQVGTSPISSPALCELQHPVGIARARVVSDTGEADGRHKRLGQLSTACSYVYRTWLLLGSPAASGTAARSTRCALLWERRLAMGGFSIRVPARGGGGGGAGTFNVSSRWRNSVQSAEGTRSSDVAERIAATCQHCSCSVRSGPAVQRPAAARRGCHLARGRPRPLRRSATPSPNHHHISCGALIGRATGSYLDTGAKARAAASANRAWGPPALSAPACTGRRTLESCSGCARAAAPLDAHGGPADVGLDGGAVPESAANAIPVAEHRRAWSRRRQALWWSWA